MHEGDYIKRRNTEGWGWADAKYLSIGVILITVIISLFDFNPDMYFWLIEILRNLVITICISFTIFVLTIIFRANVIVLKWSFFLKTILLFAVGGFVGGLLAWGINDVLFGFNVTHPWFYFIITSSLAVVFGFVTYAFISIQHKLNRTARKLAEKELNEQKLINLRTRAELEALRAKVNPHFFFNTLNSIASLIPEDPIKAEELVEKLSHLFRYTLDASNNDLVRLKNELEFVQEYLDVEKVRLADRLEYEIEMEEALAGLKIPSMLLQPLVENSIRHGISPLKEGGKISIHCYSNGDQHIIKVKDSGKGFDPQLKSEGFGLRGVKERLSLLYGPDSRLEIHSHEGVEMIIVLPREK